MNISFSEKNVILIGGSGDIGKHLLCRFLEEGFNVGTTYNNTPIDLKEALLNRYKNNLYIEKMDVTDPKSIKKGLGRLIKALGEVNYFIYNAGITEDALLGIMKLDNWNKVMDVNINGAFLTTKIISNSMIKRKKGKIVFIASYKGISGSYGQSNYATSKAALIGFSKSISRDLGKFGISVNSVCPGFIETNLNKKYPMKKEEAIQQSVISRISSLTELTDFILFLISDHLMNVSGQNFRIDSRI